MRNYVVMQYRGGLVGSGQPIFRFSAPTREAAESEFAAWCRERKYTGKPCKCHPCSPCRCRSYELQDITV